jgi:hypothetical protein
MTSIVVTRAFRNKVVIGSAAEVISQLKRLAIRF